MPELANSSPAAQVALKVNGTIYEGWLSVRVTTGIDRCAGDFELGLSSLWAGDALLQRRIRPGDECELQLHGRTVVRGYVDALDVSIDDRTHVVSVSGRDKTADLIDCSAVHKPGQWSGQTVLAIAQAVAKPFGVEVRAEVDTGKPLGRFSLNTGETAYEAIERAARLAGLLVTTDGTGALVLTRAGLARAADDLVYGQNIRAASATLDVRDRFQTYTALGQAAGGDYFNAAAAAHLKAVATDAEVQRFRPLILTGDSPGAGGTLRERAQWEADVRAARSMQVSVTVQGFTQTDGSLWRPNRLVRVKAPPLLLDEDLLLAAVSYMVGDQGCVTQLELTRADAFRLQPTKADTGKAGKRAYFDQAEPVR
jgi:prophage tail gpP-like protein